MHIKQIYVRDLHGIFSKRIHFHKDYTFIHGINGSGKTSILRAMQASLAPDLEWIALNKFSVIEIHVENGPSKFQFRYEKADGAIVLKMRVGNDRSREDYSTEKLDFIINNTSRRDVDMKNERDLVKRYVFGLFENSKILKIIQSIPTPTFLGLNRTSESYTENDQSFYERRVRAHPNPILAPTSEAMTQGLGQALDLIFRRSRIIIHQRRQLEDQLRNNISLLLFSSSSTQREKNSDWPEQKDILKYRRMKREISSTLTKIGFDSEKSRFQIGTFFDRIIDLTRKLNRYDNFQTAAQELSKTPKGIDFLYEWFEHQPLIGLIENYFNLIDNFNKKERSLRRDLTKFEVIVNEFFSDSRKNVKIGESGGSKDFNWIKVYRCS
ncbi:AAA family ATPase [Rhizobium sp. EC-SD404]|uniref:AAA family ATPase n=1 Tax=Rhizobium sp. EC-SD404 TaxID=2038389 RepID=UPI001257FE3F|nr:AAA family ATPase [Rhizobium sp. EC-SD404]VVT23437.1 hypothetical protein RHIZ404_220219 [Rhizobium sp. EC-SD404]